MNWLKRLFKPTYMSWNEYQKKVDWIDMFMFQQITRRESIKNSPGVGFFGGGFNE